MSKNKKKVLKVPNEMTKELLDKSAAAVLTEEEASEFRVVVDKSDTTSVETVDGVDPNFKFPQLSSSPDSPLTSTEQTSLEKKVESLTEEMALLRETIVELHKSIKQAIRRR